MNIYRLSNLYLDNEIYKTSRKTISLIFGYILAGIFASMHYDTSHPMLYISWLVIIPLVIVAIITAMLVIRFHKEMQDTFELILEDNAIRYRNPLNKIKSDDDGARVWLIDEKVVQYSHIKRIVLYREGISITKNKDTKLSLFLDKEHSKTSRIDISCDVEYFEDLLRDLRDIQYVETVTVSYKARMVKNMRKTAITGITYFILLMSSMIFNIYIGIYFITLTFYIVLFVLLKKNRIPFLSKVY